MKAFINNMQRSIKHNKNSTFVLFIAFFISGYSLFFTSQSWFPSLGALKEYTPIDSTLTLDNREFTLKNWTWSESQKLMEIEIDVKNNNFDGVDQYLFSCRDQKYRSLAVEPVIKNKNLLVYHISVPEEFKALSFRLKIDKGINDPYGSMIRFYANPNSLEKVDTIESLTANGYYANRLQRSITKYQQELSLYQNNIAELNDKIGSAKEEINNLTNTISLLNADEAQETRNRISQIEDNISDFTREISAIEEKVFNIQDKIQEANEKLEKYKNNKEEEMMD